MFVTRKRGLVWVLVWLWVAGKSCVMPLELSPPESEIQNMTGRNKSAVTFSAAMPALLEAEEPDNVTSQNHSHCHKDHTVGIHLVSLRWQEVGVYFTITAFVIVAGFTKLGFHHLRWLSNTIPESCVLVVLGVALGLIVFFTKKGTDHGVCALNIPLPEFTPDMFFFILLPPIVLESAYSLHDRAFFDNLGTVLVYAVVGTVFNIFTVGPSLYGAAEVGAMGNITLTFTECLIFSSLISAVDPVAVLVIFQELGVNKDLYFLVFGESLLNDGVTVVIYNTMSAFLAMDQVPGGQYALAFAAFFIVVFGGVAIGLIFGCLTALITKSTTDVRVVEPLAMLGLAYLSYITAELFHFSGIISLIVCGLVQAHYAFQNISQKSYTCVKYFTKMASATSDTIIFMFLGMVLVSDEHQWHTGFVLWSVALCFIFRFLGVFLLTGIMNRYRIKKINYEEQFIAAYGGLRGAVAFSLVNMLHSNLDSRRIFVTTTLVVILFTIFVQGITIKPLVNFLHIQRKRSDRKNLNEEIHDTAMDHIMAGIEEILGQHGDFYLRALMIYYNDTYLNKWFVRPSCESKLTRLFEKIAISEHYAHLYGPVAMIEDKVKPLGGQDNVTVIKRVRSSSISSSFKDEVLFEPRRILEVEHEDSVLMQDGVQLRKSLKKKNSKSLLPVKYNSHRVGASERTVTEDEDEDEHRVYVGDDSKEVHNTKSNVAAQALRKAFRDNPYNKLHYKYNRNLVGEEDQEMSEHLHRRHMNARRMTRLASSSRLTSSASCRVSRPRTEGAGDLGQGVIELMERHNLRRSTMAIRKRNHPALHSYFSSPEPSSPPGSPSILKSLQEASEPTSLPDVRPKSAGSKLDVASEESEHMFFPVSSKRSVEKDKKLALSRSSSSEPDDEEISFMSFTDETEAPTNNSKKTNKET